LSDIVLSQHRLLVVIIIFYNTLSAIRQANDPKLYVIESLTCGCTDHALQQHFKRP